MSDNRICLHIYLDESGEFRFGGSGDYIGGFICEEETVDSILNLTEESRFHIKALHNRGEMHMREIPNRPGEEGYERYSEFFEQCRSLITAVVRTDALPNQYLGPSEIWHKTLVLTMYEVLQKYSVENYYCKFFVSTRLRPVYDWLFPEAKNRTAPNSLNSHERMLRDNYFQSTAKTLVEECCTLLGEDKPVFSMTFLNPSVEKQKSLDDIADAFCTAQRGKNYFQNWEDNVFHRFSSVRLVPSEKAVLSRYLESGKDISSVLWFLTAGGDTTSEMYSRCLNKMEQEPDRWKVFCELVKKRLLDKIAYAEDRYTNLHAYRRLAENLPVGRGGSPEYLSWLQLRALQKCDAHAGRFDVNWPEKLNRFISSAGRGIFATHLEKTQAAIDVLLDEMQTSVVNPLRIQIMEESEKRVQARLDKYLSVFPYAKDDANVARMAGTCGQLLALCAPFHSSGKEKILKQCEMYFSMNRNQSASKEIRSFSLGYSFLTAFDLGDKVEMKKYLQEEEALYLNQDLLAAQQKNDDQWLQRAFEKNTFYVCHYLMFQANTGFQSRRFHKVLSDHIQSSEYKSLPVYLCAKWCALHMHAGKPFDQSKALELLDYVLKQFKEDADYQGALSLGLSCIQAVKQEMEHGDGAEWWARWVEENIPQRDSLLREWMVEQLSNLPADKNKRLFHIASLLPFYLK